MQAVVDARLTVHVFSITYSIRPDENRQVRIQLGYDPFPHGKTYRYYYDRYSGELLGAVDPRLSPAPDAFLDAWTTPLHFGTWGGLVSQAFYLLSTVIPTVLAYTGWVLWRKRRSRAHRAPLRRWNLAMDQTGRPAGQSRLPVPRTSD